MIAKLEFTLPEESHEHLVATHANDLLGAIQGISDWLRAQRKYGSLPKEAWTFADRTHEQLHSLLREYGVEDLV